MVGLARYVSSLVSLTLLLIPSTVQYCFVFDVHLVRSDGRQTNADGRQTGRIRTSTIDIFLVLPLIF
jgi:uncharacterized membrane protein